MEFFKESGRNTIKLMYDARCAMYDVDELILINKIVVADNAKFRRKNTVYLRKSAKDIREISGKSILTDSPISNKK